MEIWWGMPVMTIIAGVWSLSHMFKAIHAGGIGKNGSTVAVSRKNIKKNVIKIPTYRKISINKTVDRNDDT